MESEYRSLFLHYNYGLVAWSPLAGGFLTGKYLDGINNEEHTRLSTKDNPRSEFMKKLFYNNFTSEKTMKAIREVKKIAEEELKCTLADLALAWVLKFQYTSTALIGCRTVEQLEQNLKALQVADLMTPEIEARINKTIDTTPPSKMNFVQGGKPLEQMRKVAP